MTQKIRNLESTINRVGFEVASKIDKNNIEKLLGVLSGDGVYAMWVFSIDKLKEKVIDFWYCIFKEEFFINAFQDEIENKIDMLSIKKITVETLKRISEINENDKTNGGNKKKKEILKKWRGQISEDFFHKLSAKIENLLFFREILEKILIYARYHAKAMGD